MNSKQPLILSLLITAFLAGCNSANDEQVKKADQTSQQSAQTDPKQTEQQTIRTKDIAKGPQPHTYANSEPAAEHAQVQEAFAPGLSDAVSGQGRLHKMAQYAPPKPMTYLQEQNTENYAQTPINSVFSTASNPVSTFSVDVDTASYSNIRRFLNQGVWPLKEAVRVEEMINYFNYDYPQPDDLNEPFEVNTEVAVSPWNPHTHLLRVALKGYQTNKTELPPLNLVFLIDVSGSMQSADKLPLLKRAFSLLTRQLRPQDKVSMVVYAGASGVVLEPTEGDKQQSILNALDQLTAGGSTNGGAGIELAYKTAKANFNKDGINRVILASDGDFNVGTTSIDALKSLVEKQKKSGIFLTILGFGQGNYNDYLSEELSNIGNGNAFYIDSFKEARKVFSDGLTGTLQTIAKDVKIQVEFNPAYVSQYRLIGYDNRQLKQEDFKNDKVDAGDIGAGHTVTAFYEIVTKGAKFSFNDPLRYQQSKQKDLGTQNNELAFVKLRYKQPDADVSQQLQQAVAIDDIRPFAKASSEFKFAAAVVAFGERLRYSQYIDYSIEEIKKIATANLGKDPWGYRHEFVQLADNALVLETNEQ